MTATARPAERWARTVAARSSRANGRRTLVKLLDAALGEFAEHGYRDARLARVARAAGTAYGTVYVYFTSKDDLLAAVHAEADADLSPVLLAMPRLEPGAGGYQAIRAWVAAVCDVFQRHGAVMQAVTEALNDDMGTVAGRAALRSLGRASGHIAERVRSTGVIGLDPTIAALSMYALLESANRSVFRGELEIEREDLVTGLAEFVHRSVFGDAS
ncbi:MAG TPA: TetR/AcrR family transcriptional regulator [Acidimicrobiales bacterium]|nr:TetR/AcrR family transcriptional regulator [Acidimicrobiales bacterium]